MDGWMDGDEKAGRERESGVLLVWGCGWYAWLVGWLVVGRKISEAMVDG